MSTNSISLRSGVIALISLALAMFFSVMSMPVAARAQASASASLSETIHTAILKDPRSANLTEAQLDAMVAALSDQAQAQGMTPQDIAYRPGAFVGAPSGTGSTGACTDISSWLCPLGIALGYDTPDKEVPIGLWITSGLLIAVIWEMRRHARIARVQDPPKSSPGPLA